MSTMLFAPPAGDFGDRDAALAAFRATVPAAAEYDQAELFASAPQHTHRPHRSADKRAAIDESLKEG